MSEIIIEKNIPLLKITMPNANARGHGKWQRLLSGMEVGDSFFLPKTTTKHVARTMTEPKKFLGFKMVCRTVDGGVRVWRTA